MPKTCLGKMDINKNKVSFNFPKSLEIASINKESDLLHPCAHPCAHECLLFLCTFGAARLPLTTGSTLCLSTYSVAQQPDNDQTNDMVYPFGRGNIGLTHFLAKHLEQNWENPTLYAKRVMQHKMKQQKN